MTQTAGWITTVAVCVIAVVTLLTAGGWWKRP